METYYGCTIEDLRLSRHEIYWRDLFPFLESHGYILRPRYRPGWELVWPPPTDNFFASTEDHLPLPVCPFYHVFHRYPAEHQPRDIPQLHDRCNTHFGQQAGDDEGSSVDVYRVRYKSLPLVGASSRRPPQSLYPTAGRIVASERP